MKNLKKKIEDGFTLIEIAIVVVIIGLLLGGVLKGQEMIRSARSHNVITQSNGLKAAMLGFSDRYRALPGDYSRASINIPDITANVVANGTITTQNEEGDGDSFIGGSVVNGANARTGTLNRELALVWLHLGNAGYITGGFTGVGDNLDEINWTCPSDVCMTNAYSGPMFIIFDDEQSGMNATSDTAATHQIFSGQAIPVAVIADIDSKTDDGVPGNGNFRVSDRFVAACAQAVNGANATTDGTVAATNWQVLSGALCGAVYLF
ncbi:MAG: prepilin-type N-terminal cleavage/methylation domain-containing protein [Magnetococcales bacterium]|nr:prepilin-type N-terminal cleavage/methylation domain-containing protein [Magnetococcales bacterium]